MHAALPILRTEDADGSNQRRYRALRFGSQTFGDVSYKSRSKWGVCFPKHITFAVFFCFFTAFKVFLCLYSSMRSSFLPREKSVMDDKGLNACWVWQRGRGQWGIDTKKRFLYELFS